MFGGQQYDEIMTKYGGFVLERNFKMNVGRAASQTCGLRERERETEKR